MASDQFVSFQALKLTSTSLHDIRECVKSILKRIAVESGVNGQFPCTFVNDMELVVGEIIGNAYKHGVDPSCLIRETHKHIEITVSNRRKPVEAEIQETRELFADAACGRGMSIITLLIMNHPEITIQNSHFETATHYIARLTVDKPTLRSYFDTLSTNIPTKA